MNDLKKLGLVLTAIGIAILASMRLADFLEKRIELSGHGEYPVHRAMDPFEDISCLRTLIGLNADLNELDAEGLTALHLGIGYSQDAQTVEKSSHYLSTVLILISQTPRACRHTSITCLPEDGHSRWITKKILKDETNLMRHSKMQGRKKRLYRLR
ncbi:MAG TPA: hypothetical protein EYN96_08905 [Candidatus Hydrogenedentes bacterium]|nr:hypothetical protein [Candidatus Hydrogenedentota bacterium]